MAQLVPSKSGTPEDAVLPSSESESMRRRQKNREFISTLPSREGWSTPLVQYRNYWMRAHVLEEILQVQATFVPRAGDIILATQPKCSTTWLKALAFAITNRARHSLTAGGDDHPLLTRNPQHLVPFLEIPGPAPAAPDPSPDTDRHARYLHALPSPRLLATHMPLSMLPLQRHRRIVYLCRDPKDAFVSRWHFENKVEEGRFGTELHEAFAMFREGFSECGPFWDHCLEYWKESLDNPGGEVCFLRYEEIMADPVRAVRKLAAFLGVPFSDGEESSGVPREVVRLCSFETLTSLQVNQVGGVDNGNVYMPNSAFFRKGVAGDWANHMSREMGESLDQVSGRSLEDLDLVFEPSVCMPLFVF